MVLPAPVTPITTMSGRRPRPIGPPPSSTGEAPAPCRGCSSWPPGGWCRGYVVTLRGTGGGDGPSPAAANADRPRISEVGGRGPGYGHGIRPARGGARPRSDHGLHGALTAGCAVLCIAVLARPGTSTEHVVKAAGPPKSAEQIYLPRLRHLPRRRCTRHAPRAGSARRRRRARSTSSCRPGACRCRPAMRPEQQHRVSAVRGAGSPPTEVRRRHPARPRRLHRGPHRRRPDRSAGRSQCREPRRRGDGLPIAVRGLSRVVR